MVNGYSLDPHPRANFAKEQFAVVRIPRIKRDRVPAMSVEIVADLETWKNNTDTYPFEYIRIDGVWFSRTSLEHELKELTGVDIEQI